MAGVRVAKFSKQEVKNIPDETSYQIESQPNGYRAEGQFRIGDGVIEQEWRQRVVEQIYVDGDRHRALACRMLRDAHAAEDVCQRAYLKALTARDAIRNPGHLGAWMRQVIVNQCLDVLRRRRRHLQAQSLQRFGQRPGDGALNEFELSDEREQLTQLLDRLDEPIRQVVVMRVMQEMSGNEVASELQCSPAMVSRRLHRGLDQLRHWIAEADTKEVSK